MPLCGPRSATIVGHGDSHDRALSLGSLLLPNHPSQADSFSCEICAPARHAPVLFQSFMPLHMLLFCLFDY